MGQVVALGNDQRDAVGDASTWPTTGDLSRPQKFALCFILLLASWLRCEGVTSISICHYDEGVYVASGMSMAFDGIESPQLPIHAPPLFPALIASVMKVANVSLPLIGVLVSILIGILTVPMFFFLVRHKLGNNFALVASVILATSDFHIAYSRMALTDVPITFCFILAMYCVIRLHEHWKSQTSLCRHSLLLTMVCGAVIALGWYTKYIGWMPFAIALTAVSLSALRRYLLPFCGSPNSLYTKWMLVSLIIAGGLAALVYSLWYQHVDATFPGGYKAVSNQHKTYFGGFATWPHRAMRLITSLPALRHYGWVVMLLAGLSVTSILVRQLFARMKHPLQQTRSHTWLLFLLLPALAVSTANGWDLLILLAGGSCIFAALIWGRFEEILAAVWLGAFLVLVPFYHPYPRLLLPSVPAAIYLVVWSGGFLLKHPILEQATIWDNTHKNTMFHALSQRSVSVIFSLLMLGICGSVAVAATHPFGFLPTKELWRRWSSQESYLAFNRLADTVLPPDAAVICQGQPPLGIYCPRAWFAIDDQDFRTALGKIPPHRPTYWAIDFLSIFHENTANSRLLLENGAPGLELIATVPNDLNIIKLLNLMTPEEVAQKVAAGTHTDFKRRLPPRVESPEPDVILIYRVNRRIMLTPAPQNR